MLTFVKTVTVFNHAGGAGKTSIVRDVGYELARAGLRVLLIDLDPQASLTRWLGVHEVAGRAQTVYPVAVENAELPEPVRVHGLDLIPSHLTLSIAEAQMAGQLAAPLRLRTRLQAMQDRYDVVLIDSPPSLGQLAALGALSADALIVPILTNQKGLDALPGLTESLATYRTLRADLHIALFVPTMYDGRRLHDREVLADLQAQLENLAPPVPLRGAVWLDSATSGQPVGVYAPGTPVHQDVQALTAAVTRALALEVPA